MSRQKISTVEAIYQRIRQIIESARRRIARTINFEMVQAYWLVGREIIEGEQKGQRRAAYGIHLLHELAEKLNREFGKGFDETNLRNMRQFYLLFPIHDALRHELSWTHYRMLMRLDKTEARSF